MKREFKGTIGPWVGKESDDTYYVTISNNLKKHFISVVVRLFNERGAPEQTEEPMANVRAVLQLPEMIDAMIEFCDRVENGDVKSKHTYNRFKEILDKVL